MNGDTQVPRGQQRGAVMLMSQQLCALLYSCMSYHHGSSLEQSHSHSSSSWQHQEKKVRNVRNEFVLDCLIMGWLVVVFGFFKLIISPVRSFLFRYFQTCFQRQSEVKGSEIRMIITALVQLLHLQEREV